MILTLLISSLIMTKFQDGSEDSGDSDDELVIKKDQSKSEIFVNFNIHVQFLNNYEILGFIDDSGDEENVKPKLSKLSKKDRRLKAKKHKAEGIPKKSKKTGSAIKKSKKPKK